MKRQIAIAALILCASIFGASAQDGQGQAQPDQQMQIEPVQQAEGPVCPFAKKKPAAKPNHRQHQASGSCPRPKPVVSKQPAPASVEQPGPIVHKQVIIEKTEIQRVIVNRPTIVIQAPPTIVRSPCGGCGQRVAAPQPCGRCGVPVNPCGTCGGQSTGQHVEGELKPTIDCEAAGGTRTINPNTGKPSCFVPDKN